MLTIKRRIKLLIRLHGWSVPGQKRRRLAFASTQSVQRLFCSQVYPFISCEPIKLNKKIFFAEKDIFSKILPFINNKVKINGVSFHHLTDFYSLYHQHSIVSTCGVVDKRYAL